MTGSPMRDPNQKRISAWSPTANFGALSDTMVCTNFASPTLNSVSIDAPSRRTKSTVPTRPLVAGGDWLQLKILRPDRDHMCAVQFGQIACCRPKWSVHPATPRRLAQTSR